MRAPRPRTLALAFALTLGACSSTPTPLDAGSDAPTAIDAPDSSPAIDASTGADAPSATDATTGTDVTAPTDSAAGDSATPALSFCQLGCMTSTDCNNRSAAFDADNYTCEGGRCRYTGCLNDAECQSTFMSTAYVCRAVGGGIATCQLGCRTSADCGTAGSPAFDADNYECTSGTCRYTGCRDDAECTGTFRDTRYVCREVAPPDTGVPIPTATRNCVLGCTTSADCSTASPAFDADNYACERGACRYTGCRNDTECQSSFMSTAYVCR